MSKQIRQFYDFGPFRIDPLQRVLFREGKPVLLPPKIFETLLVLVEQSGRIVEKDKLIEEVWPETVVEENNLTQYISALRKTLGDGRREHRYIETIPRRGYRFAAKVQEVWNESDDPIIADQTTVRLIVREETEEITVDETAQTATPAAGSAAFSRLLLHRSFLAVLILVIALGGIIFWSALETRTSETGVGGEPFTGSIAVLPFKNLSAEGSDEYLGVGLADVLTTRLGKFKQVLVRPTNAVYKYRNVGQDPITAGRELGVETVLDGSIYRSGENLRVTMQLVRVRDGATLWTDKFDGKLTDLFAVQDSISSHVSEAMSLTPSNHEKKSFEKQHTSNIEAYQEYLKGRYFWNKRTTEGFARSIEHFERAIALDQGYALAYAGIADSLMLYSAGSKYPSAKEVASKALALDDTLAEAHTTLAYYESAYEWNWDEAEKEFRRAISLNPNYATAHHWYAYHLATMGRLDEALSEIDDALHIDPLSLIVNTDVGHILYLARRYDEAIAMYRRVMEMDPNFSVAHLRLGEAYIQKGMYEAAITELQTSIRLSGPASTELSQLGYVYAVAGRRAEAQESLVQLNKLLIQYPRTNYLVALLYAGLGEKDRAFRSLEKAYETRDPGMALYKVEPLLDPLRSDPRYNQLLEMMGLAH